MKKEENREIEKDIKDMTLQELLDIGLGSALVLKEKIEQEFSGCVQKAKTAKEDAKTTSLDVEKKGEKLREDSEKMIKDKVKEIVTEMGFATKEDIEELKKLILEKS
ncbi:MAG: hypothetical protein U9Q29_09540 [Campylobacterota bacterium]|nr:hypothetical protein [Campylobacterota bacterium]